MTILAALNRQYDRLADRGEAPPYGYSTEGIGFCLVLRPDGSVARLVDLRDASQKKRPPAPLAVPASFKRPGVTPRAFFLWDNSKFVLGLGHDKDGTTLLSYPQHQAAFRDRHVAALSGGDDPGLLALLAFVQGWRPEHFPDDPLWRDMLDQNIVFALADDFASRRFIHDRPAARLLWQRELAAAAGDARMCLVTGETAPVARLHPAIKGVWGAQSSGASLVSFNLDAFGSYGKEQGANAPVSEAAAFGYGTALNILLGRGSRQRVQVGDASVVFWADASRVGEARAARAEALAGGLLTRYADDDEEEDAAPGDGQEAARLRDTLDQVAQGRPLAELAPDLDPATRFYILALAPNAARLSVRFWLETSLGPFVDALAWHWRDLRLDPPAWKGGRPGVQALLRQTAVQDKPENIPAHLGGEVLRAILTGGRYPRSLLSLVLQRIRADGDIRPARVALCKACLVRDLRLKKPPLTCSTEDPYVSLDRAIQDPAYRLGRLFAVLESIQYSALGRVNASIRDRYFGAASATPASVFPLLLRGANHHLSVLRKDARTRGLASWFEGQIAEILDALRPDLPRHFGLEDQGRFVVGYYHQRADRTRNATPASPSAEETAAIGQES